MIGLIHLLPSLLVVIEIPMHMENIDECIYIYDKNYYLFHYSLENRRVSRPLTEKMKFVLVVLRLLMYWR